MANGYGEVFSKAMAKPMFPGAAGYGGAITVGDRVRAQQFAQGQTRRNAVQAARMAEPAGTGYGSLVTKGQANAQSQIRGGSHAVPPRRAIASRPPPGGQYARRAGGPLPTSPRSVPVSMGATRNKPQRAAQAMNEDVVKKLGKKGGLMNNKGLMIGAGAAVIAGLAMNRRGDGTSSGRSGMTRY